MSQVTVEKRLTRVTRAKVSRLDFIQSIILSQANAEKVKRTINVWRKNGSMVGLPLLLSNVCLCFWILKARDSQNDY